VEPHQHVRCSGNDTSGYFNGSIHPPETPASQLVHILLHPQWVIGDAPTGILKVDCHESRCNTLKTEVLLARLGCGKKIPYQLQEILS
jgi:hypothetical protein